MAHAHPPDRVGHGADQHHAQLPVAAIPAARARHGAAISGLAHAAAQRPGVPAGVGAVLRGYGVDRAVACAGRHPVAAHGPAGLCARPGGDGGADCPAACAARGAAGGVPPRRGRAAGRPAAQRGDLAGADRRAGALAARTELARGRTDDHCVCADYPLAAARGRFAGRRGLLPDRCARAREQRAAGLGLCAGLLCACAAGKRAGQPPAAGRRAPARAG